MRNNIISNLPTMLPYDELLEEMTYLPSYDSSILDKDPSERVLLLSDIYRLYIPSYMSYEIYAKLYISLQQSLQKKLSNAAIYQRYENFKKINRLDNNGVIGGSDSFTIIGASGIGKSSAINNAISLITQNKTYELNNGYITEVIPALVVQCPFDASVKGLMIEILRKVDEYLGTDYYINAFKKRPTTDILIGCVCQVALNHIGILIVDEIQNVANNKNGRILVGSLTQLINNSGISICMVGTQECVSFFNQAMQLARRSVGLQYSKLDYDEFFYGFCKILLNYQYTLYREDSTDSIIDWLYEHSSGIISIVVSLIHDAQEIAILNGTDVLNISSLEDAYDKRMGMLHQYLHVPQQKKKGHIRKNNIISFSTVDEKEADIMSYSEILNKAKSLEIDLIEQLKCHFVVDEVMI